MVWYYVTMGAIVVLIVWLRSRFRADQWPEPVIHPVRCEHCRRRFKNGHFYMMHVRAQHHEIWGPLKPQLDMLKGRGIPVPKPKRKRKPKLRVVK